MKIIQSILTNNPCYKDGKKIVVKGLMLHSVGCPQPSAEVFVKKWNNADSSRACVHAFIDGNTGEIYQTLPWNHRAWHGGGSSNSTHIGVEMCEPSCIKYTAGASFTCSDKEMAMAVIKRTYNAAVELFATLCKEFHLDPMADGVIISHKEGHDRGVASGHGDPDHLWNGLKSGYTMNGFRKDVKVALDGGKVVKENIIEKKMEKAPDKKPMASMVNVGDVVAITSDATYYEGKIIPEWIKKDKWIVKSISGDRVVIDENITHTNKVNSPINIKYLRKQ